MEGTKTVLMFSFSEALCKSWCKRASFFCKKSTNLSKAVLYMIVKIKHSVGTWFLSETLISCKTAMCIVYSQTFASFHFTVILQVFHFFYPFAPIIPTAGGEWHWDPSAWDRSGIQINDPPVELQNYSFFQLSKFTAR